MAVARQRSDHWDLIEGQGSLFHASYAGVSLGLLHGAQPHALVMCTEPNRPHMRGLPQQPLPNLRECVALNEMCARLTNPTARVIGFAANTSKMNAAEAEQWLKMTEDEFGLPAVDPVRMGVASLADRLLDDAAARRPARVVSHPRELSYFPRFQDAGRCGRGRDHRWRRDGRGECVPYGRYGESVDGVAAAIEKLGAAVAEGLDRARLQTLLPPGAARNAIDCALWDLEAKQTGVPSGGARG